MDENDNIFSIQKEDSHHGESIISIVVIVICVSLLVGIYNISIGSYKQAQAKDPQVKGISTESVDNIFDDQNIHLNLPEGFIETSIESNAISNNFFNNNSAIIKKYSNKSQDSWIYIQRVEVPSIISLLDILDTSSINSSLKVDSMLLSFSQLSKDDIKYEAIYQLPDKAIYSQERLLQSNISNRIFVYLVSFQTSKDNMLDVKAQADEFIKNISIF